jgi:tripartite-type tricarboxylate transporter receptor subunit TctC
VPTAREKAKDPAARLLVEAAEVPYLLSRPYVAPPDVPADRAKALQRAFMEMAKDPDFVADAKRIKVDVSPVGAEDAMRMLDLLASAPQDIKDKLKELFSAER